MNVNICVVGTLNLVFIRGPYNEFLDKFRSFCEINFVLHILFVLTLVFDKPVLYGNVAFSIIVLSSKKQYSSFLKKELVFQKTCFKAKVIKTLKIPSDDHVKTCQSLERKAMFFFMALK